MLCSIESPAIMEQIQPLQPLPHETTACIREDLFPTEMDGEGFDPRIPRRTDPGETMAADVQTTYGFSSPYGPCLLGTT